MRSVSFRRWLPALFLTLIAVLLAACGGSTDDLAVGDPAPDFTLPEATGDVTSISDYQGKQPVLLFFHMAMG